MMAMITAESTFFRQIVASRGFQIRDKGVKNDKLILVTACCPKGL